MIQLNDPKLGEFNGIFVEGLDVESAIAFVHSLIQNHQIEASSVRVGEGPVPAPKFTHVVKTDEQGRRCLIRKRFSLI